MDVNSILNGLMNATTWIEDVIINGLLGRGFALLMGDLSGILANMFRIFGTWG